MTEPEKPKIEDLADESALWKALRDARRTKRPDGAGLYSEWVAGVTEELSSPGAREEFTELCEAGCTPEGLAAAISLLKHSPLLEKFWIEMVGQPSNREKAARALENAAQTLEALYAGFIDLGSVIENEQLNKLGRIPISRLVSELRFHLRIVSFAEKLSADTETRSASELAKYILSGYVRRATGRFHDRCVSGLVGEIVGSAEYNEVAHRMWRTRNYKRLEKHYAWMTNLLTAMSVVIAHNA